VAAVVVVAAAASYRQNKTPALLHSGPAEVVGLVPAPGPPSVPKTNKGGRWTPCCQVVSERPQGAQQPFPVDLKATQCALLLKGEMKTSRLGSNDLGWMMNVKLLDELPKTQLLRPHDDRLPLHHLQGQGRQAAACPLFHPCRFSAETVTMTRCPSCLP